jgi:hypothetical protein
MKGLADIRRSLDGLENIISPIGAMDPEVYVLDLLTDNELGLVSEYRELYKAGFDTEEIRSMMGSESFEMAIAVMQKVNDDLERLTMPPVRKLVAKPKMRAAIDSGIGGTKRQKNPDLEEPKLFIQ